MLDPKHAVLEMIRLLTDNPDIQIIEYDSKETGIHVKVQRVQPPPNPLKLLISPN